MWANRLITLEYALSVSLSSIPMIGSVDPIQAVIEGDFENTSLPETPLNIRLDEEDRRNGSKYVPPFQGALKAVKHIDVQVMVTG